MSFLLIIISETFVNYKDESDCMIHVAMESVMHLIQSLKCLFMMKWKIYWWSERKNKIWSFLRTFKWNPAHHLKLHEKKVGGLKHFRHISVKIKNRLYIWGSVNQKIKLTRSLTFPENFSQMRSHCSFIVKSHMEINSIFWLISWRVLLSKSLPWY